MALKGDLASVDLAQVFQMLAMNQKMGLLLIQAPRTWRALYFEPRGVTLYYNEHTLLDKVLCGMTATGQIAEAAVRDARHHAATLGGSLVESLLAAGHLNEAQLIDAFRAAMEEEVYELFFWGNARFEFFENVQQLDGYEGVVNDSFFFSTDGLIMEAARRIDEWSYISERVSSPLDVFRAVGAEPDGLSDDLFDVLSLTDGRRSVARIVEQSGRPNFHVHKCLANLLDEGYVELVPSEQLLDVAEDCMRENRLPEAINLYERALAAGQGGPDAHHRVADAYRAASEYELAVYHITCEAEHHAAHGQVGRAAALLVEATRLISTHLGARTRLIELSVGNRDVVLPDFDALTEGKTLVEILLEVGEIEPARGLLEDLLRNHSSDLQLKQSLVNVHTKAGDMRRAVELYESIAADLVQAHDPIEAVKYLQKILILDRSRKDISERIKSLYELDERRRSRRRTLVTFSAIVVLLLGGAGAWYAYDRHAASYLDGIDVQPMLDARDFDSAIQVYDAFIASHPLTLAGKDAEAELVRIRGMQAAHLAEKEARENQRLRDAERRRTRYKGDWQRYRAAFDAGDLDNALLAIELVRKAVAQGADSVDQEWAESVRLEKCYVELYDYLARAAALERSAREKLRAGQWQAARKDILEATQAFALAPGVQALRVPFQVDSRPQGAELWQDGKPLLVDVDGTMVVRTTPTVLESERTTSQALELRRPGFETRAVTVAPYPDASSVFVLTAVPDWRFRQTLPVLTGPGLGAGYLGVGLSGGKVALAWTRDSRQTSMVIDLPELSEMRGLPVFTPTRVMFRTNDGHLACHLLDDGRRAWMSALSKAVIVDPVAQDGRIFMGDAGGELVGMSVETGRVLWTRPLDGALAALPTLSSRVLRVATVSGSIYRIDAADGRVLGEPWRYPSGITTQVRLVDGDVMVFATGSGDIVAREETGRVRWMKALGRGLKPEELVVANDVILVMAKDDELVRLDVRDGHELMRCSLGGARRFGPLVANDQVFIAVGDAGGVRKDEVMRVLGLNDFDLRWEYRDEKGFIGDAAVDGSGVYVTTSSGDVLRFK